MTWIFPGSFIFFHHRLKKKEFGLMRLIHIASCTGSHRYVALSISYKVYTLGRITSQMETKIFFSSTHRQILSGFLLSKHTFENGWSLAYHTLKTVISEHSHKVSRIISWLWLQVCRLNAIHSTRNWNHFLIRLPQTLWIFKIFVI